MAVENRDAVVAGDVLVAKYKGDIYVCKVGTSDDGTALTFTVDGLHTAFKSPSSAGKAVTGRVSCDGWKFWTLEDEVGVAKVPKEKAPKAPKEKAPRKPRAKKDAATDADPADSEPESPVIDWTLTGDQTLETLESDQSRSQSADLFEEQPV